ncbi:hypothetical protein [Croceicoccus sp. Ery15]|uniref:hypothetical protein n=1 Tax=Croceicoccus sp. Ery15 TaxID=1703338 RepID=UPI001E495765|nr:hypothetical protein [Croceicoccus sp. Ery15]
MTLSPVALAQQAQGVQADPARSDVSTPAENGPVVSDNVKIEDIPLQPLRDLNLDQSEIPPLLVDIGNHPYSTGGLTDCATIGKAIADIDVMLGDDIDVPKEERSDLQKGANKVGEVAQDIVGGLIPFRGIVREITGAKAQEQYVSELVVAATVRRAFLKGIGLERGCKAPARPAAE